MEQPLKQLELEAVIPNEAPNVTVVRFTQPENMEDPNEVTDDGIKNDSSELSANIEASIDDRIDSSVNTTCLRVLHPLNVFDSSLESFEAPSKVTSVSEVQS